MRYERGLDPFGIDLALDRFCELATAAGAAVAPGLIDERGDLPDTAPILVRTPRVNAMLGTALSVKPLLHVDSGRVVPLEKVRTGTRARAPPSCAVGTTARASCSTA